MKTLVDPPRCDQFLMASLLRNARLIYDHDPVRMLNRRQTMRDDKRGPTHRKL